MLAAEPPLLAEFSNGRGTPCFIAASSPWNPGTWIPYNNQTGLF
jgi:hypothetical protein